MIQRGLYRHFKGGLYEVLDRATHADTGEDLVVYRARSNGRVWVRPTENFTQQVNRPDYGYVGPRFLRVDTNLVP